MIELLLILWLIAVISFAIHKIEVDEIHKSYMCNARHVVVHHIPLEKASIRFTEDIQYQRHGYIPKEYAQERMKREVIARISEHVYNNVKIRSRESINNPNIVLHEAEIYFAQQPNTK